MLLDEGECWGVKVNGRGMKWREEGDGVSEGVEVDEVTEDWRGVRKERE